MVTVIFLHNFLAHLITIADQISRTCHNNQSTGIPDIEGTSIKEKQTRDTRPSIVAIKALSS